MEFKAFRNDPIIPIDEQLLKTLSTVDQQRLTKAHSYSLTLSYAPDSLADDETEEKKQEEKRRAAVGHSNHRQSKSMFKHNKLTR